MVGKNKKGEKVPLVHEKRHLVQNLLKNKMNVICLR